MSAFIRRKLKQKSCNSQLVSGSMRIRSDDQVYDRKGMQQARQGRGTYTEFWCENLAKWDHL